MKKIKDLYFYLLSKNFIKEASDLDNLINEYINEELKNYLDAGYISSDHYDELKRLGEQITKQDISEDLKPQVFENFKKHTVDIIDKYEKEKEIEEQEKKKKKEEDFKKQQQNWDDCIKSQYTSTSCIELAKSSPESLSVGMAIKPEVISVSNEGKDLEGRTIWLETYKETYDNENKDEIFYRVIPYLTDDFHLPEGSKFISKRIDNSTNSDISYYQGSDGYYYFFDNNKAKVWR